MTEKQDDAFTATLEAWRECAENMRQFWTNAAGASLGQTPFQMASPIPTLNPFQMWWPFINSWLDFWSKASTQQDVPSTISKFEKLWTDQIESWANAYGRVASSEPFGDAMGQYLRRVLTWGQRAHDTFAPQVDATMREANVPSRRQIDRLFERVIGLEERLDDVEERDQEILRALKNLAEKVEATYQHPLEESAPRRRRRVRAAKK